MSLSIPSQRLFGNLIMAEDDLTERLVWYPNRPSDPPPSYARPYYLRYALVTLGYEKPLFPSFILDDWGNEITGLKMYRWIKSRGDQFPRAEVFGYLNDSGAVWEEIQLFVRDLELIATYPVYVFTEKDHPPEQGRRLHHMALENRELKSATQIPSPADLPMPLVGANLTWWHLPPQAST